MFGRRALSCVSRPEAWADMFEKTSGKAATEHAINQYIGFRLPQGLAGMRKSVSRHVRQSGECIRTVCGECGAGLATMREMHEEGTFWKILLDRIGRKRKDLDRHLCVKYIKIKNFAHN